MGSALLRAAAAVALGLAPVAATAIAPVINLDRASRGNVAFTHDNHANAYDIACDRCHHNIRPVSPQATSCKGCHLGKDHQGLCHGCHFSNRDADYEDRTAALEAKLGRRPIPTLFKAFHALCRDCHADSNRTRDTRAPYECGGCHK